MSRYRFAGYFLDDIMHVRENFEGTLSVSGEEVAGELLDHRQKKQRLEGIVNIDKGERVITLYASNRRADDPNFWMRIRKDGATAMIGDYTGVFARFESALKKLHEKIGFGKVLRDEPSTIRGRLDITIYELHDAS